MSTSSKPLMFRTELTKYVVGSNTILPCRPHSLKAERIAGASSVLLEPLALTMHVLRAYGGIRVCRRDACHEWESNRDLHISNRFFLIKCQTTALPQSLLKYHKRSASAANPPTVLCWMSGSLAIPGPLRAIANQPPVFY